MIVTAKPNLLYHKDGVKPAVTRVDAMLTFQDDYWDDFLSIDRWILENLADCKLPRGGGGEGQAARMVGVRWLAGAQQFRSHPFETDGDGKALATGRTVPETTPEGLRTFQNQRDAVGAIIVRASGLVPGWDNLERIVELIKDTGNAGDAPLTVIYYQAPH